MITHLRGRVVYKDIKSLTLENQGVGYKVFCSPATLRKVSEGEELKIFTSLYLREESAELYGFLTAEELGLFDVLSGISGVGPKTAMMLASLGSLEKLKEMMEGGRLPQEIKGIGQKRMQKILLELTGKIKEIKAAGPDLTDGTLDALISLGFQKQRAKDALSKIPAGLGREEKVKRALKILGRGS